MTITEIQNLVIVALSLLLLSLAIHAWRGWDTARSMRQVILLSPVVCEVCATRSTGLSHVQAQPLRPDDQVLHPEPCEGGMMWKETHQYIPARLVYQGEFGAQ